MKYIISFICIIGISFFGANLFLTLPLIEKTIISKNNKVGINEVSLSKSEIMASDLVFDAKNSLKFQLYINNEYSSSYNTFEEAVLNGEKYNKSAIKEKNISKWIWDNYPQFNVFIDSENTYNEFSTFIEAIKYGKQYKKSYIYNRKNNSLIWANDKKLPTNAYISTELILQLPQLPRGCEVTSLAMLLRYKGFNVEKMVLADKIKKDNTIYTEKEGKIYYGNPNDGFVGSIYNLSENGLGVYHKPLYDLMGLYATNSRLDITGCEFDDIMYFLTNDCPVVVIINATYDVLPKSQFITWHTPSGIIDITYREHSVLITGYDDKYVYFNDPLGISTKASKQKFINAWKQMGSQALTVN